MMIKQRDDRVFDSDGIPLFGLVNEKKLKVETLCMFSPLRCLSSGRNH